MPGAPHARPVFLIQEKWGLSVIRRIRDALGWLTGSLLGVLVIVSLFALPVSLVLWIGVALGVGWAIRAQVSVVIWLSNLFAAANDLLPAWVWFILFTLCWLAFLDVHVRGLVRDELAKHERSSR